MKNIIVVALSLCVMAAAYLLDPNVKDMGLALSRARPLWLAAALFAMLLSYLSDNLMLLDIMRLMGYRQGFFSGLTTTMLGFFYSALTPFQSGGQPMQVIRLRSRGVPVGASTSALCLKFLAWQLAMLVLATAGLFILGDNVAGSEVSAKAVLYAGYGLNLALLAVIALALVFPDTIRRMGGSVLRLLHRVRLIRTDDAYSRACGAWENVILDYSRAMDFVLHHKLRMLPVFLFGFMEAACYMAVTYCIYRGFGLAEYSIYHVVLLQALLTVAVSFIPLPGAAGASEGGFYLVFSSLFGGTRRFAAMMIWRFCTYYLSILLGFGFVLANGLSDSKKSVAEGN